MTLDAIVSPPSDGLPLHERLSDALARTPSSDGLFTNLANAGSVPQFKPKPIAGLRELSLGPGEGTLLEHPHTAVSLTLTEDEVGVLHRMDGEKPVMELLYDDMASTGTLALERVAGLVARLKAAGMLEGDHAIGARLERLFDRRSWAARTLGLARKLGFLPLLREVGSGLIGGLSVPAGLLLARPIQLALVVLAFSGAWPAFLLLRRDEEFEDRMASLFQVASPPRVLLAFALAAWAVHMLRKLVPVLMLAAQGVQGAAVDVGLAGGLPVVRASDATRRRSGRARTRNALRATLLAESSLAAAAAWVAKQQFDAVAAARSVLMPLPCVAPASAIGPVALAGAAALFTFLDLCPFVGLLGYRFAAAASGFEDLRARAISWLVRRMPRRLAGRREPPPPPAWTPPTEGASDVLLGDTPPPVAPSSTAEERWYVGWTFAAIVWVVGFAALALIVTARVLVPLIATARVSGTTGALAIAFVAVLALSAPVALSVAGVLVRIVAAAARGATALTGAVELSLYIPLALAIAVGGPLAAVIIEPDADRVASVFVNVVAALICPVLSLLVRRDHRGSRMSIAFFWLTVYFMASLTAIPLWMERFGLLPPLGDLARLLLAASSLSFFCLFPFFLFTFLNSGGRWVAAVALAVPFAAAALYFQNAEAFLSEPGIRFLAMAGPASFAVLSFFTMFGYLDTPLTAFWAFLAASLGLQAFARFPQFSLAIDPAAREELAFSYGVQAISGLLAVAALGAHRVAFRRLRVPDAGGPVGPASSEAAVLVDGFVRLANALLSVVGAHLGAGRIALVTRVLDARMRALDIPVTVHEERLVIAGLDDTPVADVARRLRKVAGELLRGIAYLAGEDFLKRSLRLTQGCLYWVERELLSYWVFEGVDWGTACRPVTYALHEPSRTELLSRIPLFAALPDDELSDLAFRLRRRDAVTGEIIVRQGEPGHEFFVIVEGKAEVLHEDAAGLPRHLATLGPLDCFGELSLLEGVPRTATVRATETTLLLTLSETDFRRLLAGTPEAAERVVPLIRFGGFLSRVPLFADLPPSQLLALAQRLRVDEVEAGTVVVTEGEQGDRFFLVREGTLEVTREGRTLGRLGAGEYFGEIALLTNSARVASVTAVTPAVLVSLGQEDFYVVLKGFLGTFRRLEEFAHRRLYMLRTEAS